MTKRFAPILFEAFNSVTGAVVGVYPTIRRASNRATMMTNAVSRFYDGAPYLVRRVVTMDVRDIFDFPASPALQRIRCEHLQRSGFWQPTGYDKYTGRYQYWY